MGRERSGRRLVTSGASPDHDRIHRWLRAYEAAWRTPGTDALADLFAAGARYRTAPYDPPVEGLAAIAELWEAERNGPDEAFSMQTEIVAAEADTAVVRVEVQYGDPEPQEFRDLWIVRLDEDDRCIAFEEWPFWPPGTSGAVAGHGAPGPKA